MEEFITRINLHKLKNETHVQFNENIDTLFIRYQPQIPNILPLYGFYKPALDNEVIALDFIRKSELTQPINEQDHIRDSIYRGFVDSIKGARNHFDEESREAARKLYDVCAHYGNISKKTLDDETAAINDLLRELQTPELEQAIAILDFRRWTERLTDENRKFEDMMMLRYDEIAQKTAYRMKTTRAEVDKYYHAIVNQIENQLITGNTVVEILIREMNAVIERFKSILAQEQGRKKKNEEGK
jgi:hypothetical protein